MVTLPAEAVAAGETVVGEMEYEQLVVPDQTGPLSVMAIP
jgi:hypothetical protein